MRQLYYVIRTLLRGRGSNLIKIISLGLGLTMSILLFARVAFEQTILSKEGVSTNVTKIMTTFIRFSLFSLLTVRRANRRI